VNGATYRRSTAGCCRGLHEILVAIVVAVSIGACADSQVELVPVPNPEASAFEPR
jgi:hypothetical protein